VAVPNDEFQTMLARARNFRRRVDELGSVSGPVIAEGVRDRLRRRLVEYLPPAQRELAEEIVTLLEHPELSQLQAAQLERAFFDG
jgi:hypothetical protein